MQCLDDVDIRMLLHFEADLTHRSLDEFIQFIRSRYDLANVSYCCPSLPAPGATNPFLFATYSSQWIQHYRTQGYAEIDPVKIIGARSIAPIDWAKLPRTDKKARRLFAEAKDAGVGAQGLTIPVRGPSNGLWALFNVTSNDSPAEWIARRFDLTRDIVHVAHYVHQRVCALHLVDETLPDLDTLTKRETEALEWSAEGKSINDISILMRISAQTVKAHLDSARYKLHALNPVHAVTKALQAGIIR
jgi:LuxR family quorum-sensing system transcriptional regulator SinR